ncbi:MAG: DUF1800 domain-containing protein, partial [Bdellovibrionota bacterium]
PDSALETKLKAFPSLTLSMEKLEENYPLPAMAAKDDAKRPAEILVEISRQKILRAVESRRQLSEVLADFWFNHFNVDFTKGAVKWLVTDYEMKAIRPHLFGKFRDLLLATARHPAMLFYLDNWLNVKDGLEVPNGKKDAKRGINENYARELLELHTLGVDGGYTQKDVIEVARALSGWGIDKPRINPAFRFHPRAHDENPKTVLGFQIDSGGESDGVSVIDLVATHPSTARFIATKLCRRFVADNPPKDCVEAASKRFLATGGDLRETYKAIFASRSFYAPDSYKAKIKRPFEFVASALRALNDGVETDNRLPALIDRLGEPLYRCQPPTGYKDVAAAWVSSGALVSRLNFAAALSAARITGVDEPGDLHDYLHERKRGADLGDEIRALYSRLSRDPLTPNSQNVVESAFDLKAAEDGEKRPLNRVQLLGMLLGTPEFQRK